MASSDHQGTVYVSLNRNTNTFGWRCGCGKKQGGYTDERRCRDEGFVHQRTGSMTGVTATVEVLASHDGTTRLVSSVARCPICDNKFEDRQIAVVVSELAKLATVTIHRKCLEALLDNGPAEGVTDKQFEKYRRQILKGGKRAS